MSITCEAFRQKKCSPSFWSLSGCWQKILHKLSTQFCQQFNFLKVKNDHCSKFNFLIPWNLEGAYMVIKVRNCLGIDWNLAPDLTCADKDAKWKCAGPENIHTPPTERIGISWEARGSVRPTNLKKCMKLNWNFQRGGGVFEKIPSMGEVWKFSGITQY